MKNLFFEEVKLEELNSNGASFWAGVTIGAGIIAAGAGVGAELT